MLPTEVWLSIFVHAVLQLFKCVDWISDLSSSLVQILLQCHCHVPSHSCVSFVLLSFQKASIFHRGGRWVDVVLMITFVAGIRTRTDLWSRYPLRRSDSWSRSTLFDSTSQGHAWWCNRFVCASPSRDSVALGRSHSSLGSKSLRLITSFQSTGRSPWLLSSSRSCLWSWWFWSSWTASAASDRRYSRTSHEHRSGTLPLVHIRRRSTCQLLQCPV